MDVKITITAASWHRNGIFGVGFYAILFTDKGNGDMVASLFDEPGYCAVYKIEELANGNVEFANGNSWRGDVYEAALKEALPAFLKEHDGNRVGPFSMLSGDALAKALHKPE